MVDGDLLGSDGALARPRPRARDRRRQLLWRPRPDQRVHDRLPDPEPRPCARRRRGALVRVRPRVQRAARERGASASLAGRVDRLLALPPDRRGNHRALRPARAGLDAAAHGRLRRPGRDALPDPLSDRCLDRALRDRHRDPEQLRPVLDPRADARLLERRDHRRPRRRRAAGGHGQRQALRLRRFDRRRHGDPAAVAAAVAARTRRASPAGARRPRSGCQAGLQADGAGDARARPDQRQRRDRHCLRLQADRPDDRTERDRQGLPRLHAAPGDVLGRSRDDPVSVAGSPGDTGRPRRLPRHGLDRPPSDQLPADPGRRRLRGSGRADHPAALRARCVRARSDARRRRCARCVLARADLQRDDADAESRLLQPPGAVGPDVRRPRGRRVEHGALRRPLPRRRLGHPARDLAREHRGGRTPLRRAAASRGTHRPTRRRSDRSYSSPLHPRCSPPLPTASGDSSTTRSGDHSSASSARSERRCWSAAPPI